MAINIIKENPNIPSSNYWSINVIEILFLEKKKLLNFLVVIMVIQTLF